MTGSPDDQVPGQALDQAPLALIIPSFRGGGAERVMILLANGFARRGRTVDLIVCEGVGPYAGEVDDGVRVIDLGRSRVASCTIAIARYLRRARPMAVISTMSHLNVVVSTAHAVAFTGRRTRLILREAMPVAHGLLCARSWPLRTFARWAYRRGDDVVFVSDCQRRLFEAVLPQTPDKHRHVVFNPAVIERRAADPERSDAIERSGMDVRADECVDGRVDGRSDERSDEPDESALVLGVGRLAPQKDFDTLIRAFALVRRDTPCSLTILGEGAERDALQRLVRELGIEASVSLPGFQADPFAYMRAARVFVLSSRWEGMPNALVQAVALGTPVVATDCECGPREVLRDGAIGPLVPVGDVAAMARAIAAQLARSSRPDVPEDWSRDFAPETTVERYLAICCRVPAREGTGGDTADDTERDVKGDVRRG